MDLLSAQCAFGSGDDLGIGGEDIEDRTADEPVWRLADELKPTALDEGDHAPLVKCIGDDRSVIYRHGQALD